MKLATGLIYQVSKSSHHSYLTLSRVKQSLLIRTGTSEGSPWIFLFKA